MRDYEIIIYILENNVNLSLHVFICQIITCLYLPDIYVKKLRTHNLWKIASGCVIVHGIQIEMTV